MLNFKTLLAAAVIALPLAGASATQPKDILATAAEQGKFSTLIKAVEAAGLSDKLKGAGPYTLFAPTDEAFARLGKDTFADLMDPANREELAELLKAHIVPGRVMSGDLTGTSKSLLTTASIGIKIDGTQGVRAENAKVVTGDMLASNGVIHVIDQVIHPVE